MRKKNVLKTNDPSPFANIKKIQKLVFLLIHSALVHLSAILYFCYIVFFIRFLSFLRFLCFLRFFTCSSAQNKHHLIKLTNNIIPSLYHKPIVIVICIVCFYFPFLLQLLSNKWFRFNFFGTKNIVYANYVLDRCNL